MIVCKTCYWRNQESGETFDKTGWFCYLLTMKVPKNDL